MHVKSARKLYVAMMQSVQATDLFALQEAKHDLDLVTRLMQGMTLTEEKKELYEQHVNRLKEIIKRKEERISA